MLKKLLEELGVIHEECKAYYIEHLNNITLSKHRLQNVYDSIKIGNMSVKEGIEKIKKINTSESSHLDILERMYEEIREELTKELKNHIKEKDEIYEDLKYTCFGLPYDSIKKRIESIL